MLQIAFFGHKSSTDYPISAKFCMRSRRTCRWRPRDKNCRFQKFKI